MRAPMRIATVTGALCLSVSAMVGGIGVGVAGAAPTGAAAPPATGVYQATINPTSGKSFQDIVSLKANGRFTISGGGPKGKWSEKGTTVSMKGTDGEETFILTIKQMGSDLGSKASPGTIVLKGTGQVGTWYAVPKA